jgi:hypothetical protein
MSSYKLGVYQPLKKVTLSELRHFSESSFCGSLARHFTAFSGLFQAFKG